MNLFIIDVTHTDEVENTHIFINSKITSRSREKSFFQEVKQETFKISWPTKKDTMTGALMVFGLASIAAIFFLLLDQILRFLLNIILNLSF